MKKTWAISIVVKPKILGNIGNKNEQIIITEIPVTISAFSIGTLLSIITLFLVFLLRLKIPIAAKVPITVEMIVVVKATLKEFRIEVYKPEFSKISLYQSRVKPVKLFPVLEELTESNIIINIGKYNTRITKAT